MSRPDQNPLDDEARSVSDPVSKTTGSRDYNVTDRGQDFVVTIGADHQILSVVRSAPLKDFPVQGSRPGRVIWHPGLVFVDSPMPREVSRVIAASRAIPAEEDRKDAANGR
jgi:hypothetical protein